MTDATEHALPLLTAVEDAGPREVPPPVFTRRQWVLAASVVVALAGVALVLVAVVVLAGWPWASLVAGLVLVFFGFVLSTKVDVPVKQAR